MCKWWSSVAPLGWRQLHVAEAVLDRWPLWIWLPGEAWPVWRARLPSEPCRPGFSAKGSTAQDSARDPTTPLARPLPEALPIEGPLDQLCFQRAHRDADQRPRFLLP